jgi:hypothetical protein
MKRLFKKSVSLALLLMLSVNAFSQEATDSTEKKKFDWKTVPVFSTQVVNLTDDEGNPLLNEDGTQQFRVFLVDQFGNRRSKESVNAQHKAVKKAIAHIAGKTTLGTVIGGGLAFGMAKLEGKSTKEALVHGAVGGVVGGLAGYSFTDEDRKIAKAQKESLKEQEKMIKEYSKTFTDEGIPVDAKADLTNVNGFDFTKGEPVSLAANDVKKELDSEAFNNTDTSAWEF